MHLPLFLVVGIIVEALLVHPHHLVDNGLLVIDDAPYRSDGRGPREATPLGGGGGRGGRRGAVGAEAGGGLGGPRARDGLPRVAGAVVVWVLHPGRGAVLAAMGGRSGELEMWWCRGR